MSNPSEQIKSLRIAFDVMSLDTQLAAILLLVGDITSTSRQAEATRCVEILRQARLRAYGDENVELSKELVKLEDEILKSAGLEEG